MGALIGWGIPGRHPDVIHGCPDELQEVLSPAATVGLEASSIISAASQHSIHTSHTCSCHYRDDEPGYISFILSNVMVRLLTMSYGNEVSTQNVFFYDKGFKALQKLSRCICCRDASNTFKACV